MIHFIQPRSSAAVATQACCFISCSYIIQRVSVLETMLIALYLCSSTSFTSSVRVSAYTRAQSLTSSLIWRTWASTAQRITILLISVSQATPSLEVCVCGVFRVYKPVLFVLSHWGGVRGVWGSEPSAVWGGPGWTVLRGEQEELQGQKWLFLSLSVLQCEWYQPPHHSTTPTV